MRSFLVDAAGALYAIGLEGTFRSATAGENWSEVTPVPADTTFGGPTTFIAADPIAPGILYATSGNPSSRIRIFKTIDGALSWNGPIFDASIYIFPANFEVSATSQKTIWRGENVIARQFCAGSEYVSLDGGETWRFIFSGPAMGPIVTDPVRSSIAYVGTSECSGPYPWGVYQLLSSGRVAPVGQAGFVVQKLAMAPDGSILYALADGKLATLRLPLHPSPATVPFR